MNPAFSISRSRAPALIAVLLLHLAAGMLMLPEQRRLPVAAAHSTELRLIPLRRPPPPKAVALAPRIPTAAPQRIPGPNAISLPELPTLAAESQSAAPTPAIPAPASAPAPLDLRLPARVAAPAAPSLAEQMRADPRANSPRESAEQRMANAMGGQGWRTIELEDGARKIMGPFGECFISRPSMVNQIPGHPHAGLVPNKISSCGGIEKGSLKHQRPR